MNFGLPTKKKRSSDQICVAGIKFTRIFCNSIFSSSTFFSSSKKIFHIFICIWIYSRCDSLVVRISSGMQPGRKKIQRSLMVPYGPKLFENMYPTKNPRGQTEKKEIVARFCSLQLEMVNGRDFRLPTFRVNHRAQEGTPTCIHSSGILTSV